MTANKPEVVAWMKPAPPTMNSVDSVITAKERRGASRMTLAGHNIALVRLSDYEALQAECEKLRMDAERRQVDLDQFRPAVEHWKAQAEVGEIAYAIKMHYKLTADDYRKRATEADRLLAIIDQFSRQEEQQ